MNIAEKFVKKKILIVDDASSARMLTRAILLDAGFKFVRQASAALYP
jgi:PleD family two-component response regulator